MSSIHTGSSIFLLATSSATLSEISLHDKSEGFQNSLVSIQRFYLFCSECQPLYQQIVLALVMARSQLLPDKYTFICKYSYKHQLNRYSSMCSTMIKVRVFETQDYFVDEIINNNRIIMLMDHANFRQDKLILPNSLFVVIWSIFFSLAIIAYFALAIFSIGFQTKSDEIFNGPTLTSLVICFCFADSIIYVNIGIIIKGKLVKNRKKNFINYTKSWLFITDFIVLIILFIRLGLSISNNKQYFLVLSILDLIVFLKFFNIKKYDQILKFYYFDDWSLLIYEFSKHVILLALLCHVVGCIFFLIDILLIEAEWYPLQEHWLIDSQAMSLLYYAPKGQQYLYSFYFSIVTLSSLAYGDITPLNPTEVAFVLVILAFLLLFYVYIFTQIYEVFSWFNRKSIKIKQERHKISLFLKNFNIPPNLRGRIISEFEFRENEGQQVSTNDFINEISVKLANSFASMPYKYDLEKFIPRFIINSGIQLQFFNGALQQKFYTPQQRFNPFDEQKNDKWMYFVFKKNVLRTFKCGTSTLIQQAEKQSWLGINAFMTSQFDINEKWHVETPTQITALSFLCLIDFMKINKKSYEKYIQQCHCVLYAGGTAQDLNKCILCWKQCHSSLYCYQYRPQSTKLSILARKTSKLAQICRLMKQSEVTKRLPLKRLNKQSRKTKNVKLQKIPKKQLSTQAEIERLSYNPLLINRSCASEEVVYLWSFYMVKSNIQTH